MLLPRVRHGPSWFERLWARRPASIGVAGATALALLFVGVLLLGGGALKRERLVTGPEAPILDAPQSPRFAKPDTGSSPEDLFAETGPRRAMGASGAPRPSGIFSRIAAMLRRPQPVEAPKVKPPHAESVTSRPEAGKKLSLTAGSSGGAASDAASTTAIGAPANAKIISSKAPPRFAPPPSTFDKFWAALRRYMGSGASQKPKKLPPPSLHRGVGTGDSEALSGGAGAIGGPTGEKLPGASSALGIPSVVPAPAESTRSGGGAGGLGSAPPTSADCGDGKLSLAAPTRTDPKRALCSAVPSSERPWSAEALSGVRDQLMALGKTAGDEVLGRGLAALKQTVGWASQDVGEARGDVVALGAETDRALLAFRQFDLQEAGLAYNAIKALSAGLSGPDSALEGLSQLTDRLAAASGCLALNDDTDLAKLAACHAGQVTPALGSGVRSVAEQLDFIAKALESDRDVIDARKALRELYEKNAEQPDSAPQRRAHLMFELYLQKTQGELSQAARAMSKASSAWDSFKEKDTLATGLTDSSAKLGADLASVTQALGSTDLFRDPEGRQLFAALTAAATGASDSTRGWRDSRRARARPIDRLEAAVDGSRGAVDALLGVYQAIVKADALAKRRP